MRSSRKLVIILFLALCALPPLSPAADKKQLSAALAAVEANLKTPAGKDYDAALGKDFSRHASAMKPCRQSAAPADFDAFVRLKSDGKVDDVLVYPETAFANCARNALLNDNFAPPPHDQYWINIHMQFKK